MPGVSPVVSTQVDNKTSIAVALRKDDPAFPPDIQGVISHGTRRWLKNDEVLALLEMLQREDVTVLWPTEAAERPEAGSLFAFSRAMCRAFRNDRHEWRKKNGTRWINPD